MRARYLVLLLLFSCAEPKSQSQGTEFYSEEFKWKITLPEGFEKIPEEEAKLMEQKGLNAFETTYDTNFTNTSKNIFAVRVDQMNVFEANATPFDTAVDGTLKQALQELYVMMVESMSAQMPGTELDTSSTMETVAGFPFHHFNMKVHYPNDMLLNIDMYTRQYNKQMFGINIMYTKPELGDAMMEAWKGSRFE